MKYPEEGNMKRNAFASFVATLVLTALLLFFGAAHAAPLKDSEVPQNLSEWKSWVLNDMDDRLCPTNYNDEHMYRCTWPSRLKLYINAKGGSFEQALMVFAKTWVSLPGGNDTWPENVKDANKDIPLMDRNNSPSLYLQPGKHLIKGSFKWEEMPEMIRVPSETGIVSLSINGKAIDYPVIDKTGRLWLQKRVSSENQENSQSISIFRLLQDTIPMKVTNHFQINISGQAREIRFGNVLLEGSIPMRMNSPLPARISNNGELMIQARPGRWEIGITTRFIDSVNQLGPVPCNYGQEIWSFSPQNHLRMVEVEGAPSVEPGRTNMPSAWKQYSAYIIEPETSINFKILKRGDPDPAPDRLNLEKTLWLDFNGDGFTIQDIITGKISRTWRLSMSPPGKLGRVEVDGQGQLITAYEKKGEPGVEIRKGQLNMTADSRYTDSISLVPAIGWDHNFNSMSGMLELPPGWRLFAAKGVDTMPGTWVLKWTLLDFFLVLIISAAVFKLRGWKWGLLALVTMVLVYHEPGAPKTVWLHILAAIALLRVLPAGKFKRLVYVWGGAATIALIIMSIPFMVTQVRCGLFPQLELPGRYMQQVWEQDEAVQLSADDKRVQALAEAEPVAPAETKPSVALQQADAPKRKFRAGLGSLSSSPDSYKQKKLYYTQDPNALIQTGPGLPSWKWKSIPMTWNGPVNKDQKIRLWLIPPSANMVLSFVRVLLLAFMIIGIIEIRSIWRKIKGNMNSAAAAASVLLLFVGTASAETDSALFPPQELLKEYQTRLLEKADCFPHCADCLRMSIKAEPEHLTMRLEIHAAARTAVPLPGSLGSWVPDQVLLGNEPVQELSRDKDGILWALVPEGIQSVVMIGKTGPGNSIQIPLPLKPHYATYTSNGWDVQGIHKDGKVESGIQLTRLKKEEKDAVLSTSVSLPPFLHVERVIRLGLNWEMTTTVTRATPIGTPVVVSVPLVEGESVTKAGIRVEDGKALVNMGPKSTRVWWNSSLKTTDEISLTAPASVPWTETWVLDASPIWHCETSGIPVVHHQDEQGHLRPKWQPWPGEAISINVTRPQAIPGRMVTIDTARLIMTPGFRSNKVQLSLRIRTSKGGQHQITLPEGADLQLVRINSKTQPIRQEGKKVVIPLQPGSQSVFLEWNSPASSSMFIKGPAVQIGKEAVNAHVTFKMPHNRWILWAFGPTLGPAVLYWSYVLIIILIALGLGRIPITPLRTHHWLILSLGLTQIPLHMALIVAAWFLILGLRKKYQPPDNSFYYDLLQLVIVIWTLAAFICLYAAISEGLLGIPDMQISGNSSTAVQLNWTEDRIGSLMPQPSVISLPKIAYNTMILIWALWLVIYLIKWLKWGWSCFIEGGIWKKRERKPKTPPPLDTSSRKSDADKS
jgi:hypothetical protein